MKRLNTKSGFTLIELMIVVAIIAIIASIAIPKLMSARISANENAAIATLRSIASAQAQIESACAIDTDADGGGEFGFFAELAGVAPMRIYDAGAPGAGTDPGDRLSPAILPTAFGDIVADSGAEGVVERAGYFFKIYLPDDAAAGIGEAGDGTGASAAFPDPDESEILWCCYAWPADGSKTGNRAFFVNQEGDLLQTSNVNGGSNTAIFYSGDGSGAGEFVPTADAAFLLADDMGSSIAIAAMLEAAETSVDENVWTVVGN